MEKKICGFNKNVFYLGVVSFFNDVSSEIIYPLLPVFLTGVLKASLPFVGLVEGIAETTASMLKLFSGWISDKTKKRKIFVFSGYILSSITRPLISIAASPWHVLALRITDRIGKGIRTSPRDALISESSQQNERGKSFGFHRAMDHAGAVTGPVIATIFLTYITNDLRSVFLIAFIPAIISIVILFLFIREQPQNDITLNKGIKTELNLKIFNKNFQTYLLIIFIFTLGNSSDAFLILRAKDTGISTEMIPALWILLHIVKMVSSTPGGILSDKIGRKKVIIYGWIIYFLTYLGFAFSSQSIHIILLFMLYGFFFGLTEGTEKAFVSDLVPSEIRGSAYGAYNFVTGIALLPASIIMGFLWQKFGVFIAFSFGGGLALLSAIMLTVFVSENSK